MIESPWRRSHQYSNPRACQPSIKCRHMMGTSQFPKFDALCTDNRDSFASRRLACDEERGLTVSRTARQAQLDPRTGSTCVSLSPAHRLPGISWPLLAGLPQAVSAQQPSGPGLRVLPPGPRPRPIPTNHPQIQERRFSCVKITVAAPSVFTRGLSSGFLLFFARAVASDHVPQGSGRC